MDLLRLYYTTNLGTMVDEGVFDAYVTANQTQPYLKTK